VILVRGDIYYFLPFRRKQEETGGIGKNAREWSRRQRRRLSRPGSSGFIAGAQQGAGHMPGI